MYYRVGCWLAILLCASVHAGAQAFDEEDHINWRFSSLKQSGSEWKLVFTAVIDPGWHLYSQSTPGNGPMPVSFEFIKGKGYRLSGEVKETGNLKKSYDDVFMVDVWWYEGQVVFTQALRAAAKGTVSGEIHYSVCSGEMCVPGSVRFDLDVSN
ncbi:MAG TPA: protein-disulfide reductase DsbD domain-containing protein [Cyclobacteriaceae bacterium]|nr:protein-disulfide reductase DsbD domain-containing protein [Cyclobacteriaceae bacterium]